MSKLKVQATVSERALFLRITRKVRGEGQKVVAVKSKRDWPTLGHWLVVDDNGEIVRSRFTLEELGRDLGALEPYEVVVEE